MGLLQKPNGMQVLLMVPTPLLQRLVPTFKWLTLWTARQLQLRQPCSPSRSKRRTRLKCWAGTEDVCTHRQL